MGKEARIQCGSCQGRWDTSAATTAEYFRGEIEAKPCPVCGSYTLAVITTEKVKRRNMVRSFVMAKRMPSMV